ncbi:hypothetical protein ACWCXC_31805 [Streptomyces sp. NPDC001515]
MNGLDALLTGGQILAVNAAAGDMAINAATTLGPGLLAATTGAAVWCGLRWVADRCRDRAERREYAARAHRLNRVADQADRIIAAAGNQLAEHLHQQIHTTNTREGEK